jgi:hypothetical protein
MQTIALEADVTLTEFTELLSHVRRLVSDRAANYSSPAVPGKYMSLLKQ